MYARKACFLVSLGSLLFAGLIILLAIVLNIEGLVLGIALIASVVLLGLCIAALVSAFQTKPGQALGDNILLALLDLIILR
jgi:hypothetical protein